MDDPMPERRTDVDDRSPPDFDALTDPAALVRGERTRDDFFDAVLGLDTPATVSEVADHAGHGEDAAREYLEWFERMGIVVRVTDAPATYRRNQAYLDWRRVQRLRTEYTPEELLDFLSTATKRAEQFATRFDANSPSDVSIASNAAATDRSVEDVWADVSAWATARRQVALLERALQTDRDGSSTRQPVA